MRKYRYIYSFLLLFAAFCLQQLYAQQQKVKKNNPPQTNTPAVDSPKRKVLYETARLKPGSKEYIDSMKQARQRYVDSMKAARARDLDSMRQERQRLADSTQAANTRYRDSVRAVLDAQRAARMRIADSLRAVQKRRADSLQQVKAYRASKGYKDSVARVRQARLDSIAAVRKKRNEELAAARQHIQDSLAAVRKQYNDSVRAVIDAQKARNAAIRDSIAVVRAARTDSLAKAKAAREAQAQKRAKDREKKTTAKAREKEQKKRDAYSNEQMRKKRWGFMRRAYHNTTTRYNYYYNAHERMRQMEDNMLKMAANNYEELLPLYPFDPDKDSTRMASDMDSLIRRAGVGIQIHDPRSKWQDNLYLLVGQAYYYKGDYTNAANAFKYIVAAAEAEKKEKEKEQKKKNGTQKNKEVQQDLAEKEKHNLFTHISSKNDAMLWLARTLAQDSQVNLAQTVLNMVRSSKQFDESLAGRFAAAQAFVDLRQKEYTEATDDLSVLYQDGEMPKWLRERAAYLSGQILQRENKLAASDSAFAAVIDLKPDMEMDFNARIHMVNNSINAGNGDAKKLIATLSQMSRETKYKTFYDKIYFTIARVSERNKDFEGAIENYRKSIAQVSNNVRQKGQSYAAMGALYYDQNQYNEAKNAYDSALAFLTVEDKPGYEIAQQRAQALDQVAAPGNQVRYLDSLLHLTTLSEKEQRAVAKKYIKDLEKRINDSLYRAQNPTPGAGNNMLAGPVTLGGGGSSWYFANPMTVQQGMASFKQKWGERTLKDAWNRSVNSSAGSLASAADEEDESDPYKNVPSEDELLAQIPKDPKELQALHDQLKQSLFDLGTAYFKGMEDIPMAMKTYDDLDQRYPNHPNHAEELYNRYRMALSRSEISQADAYAQALKTKYADSKWAGLISTDAATVQEQSSQEDIAAHYERTYSYLMQQQFLQAQQGADSAQSLYPNAYAPYANRYALVRIAAIAGQGNYGLADSLLNGYIGQHQTDETIDWARSLQQYVKQMIRQPDVIGATASGGSKGPQVLPSSGVAQAYSYKPNGLHYVLIACTGDQNRLQGLRAALKDYHQSVAGRKSLATSLSPLDGQSSLLVVKEFTNAAAAQRYITEIRKVNTLFRDFSSNSEYHIICISADNIIKLFTEKDWGKYYDFYKATY